MDFGAFTLDFGAVAVFFRQPAFDVVIQLLVMFGWAILAWLLLFVGLYFLAEYKENKYTEHWKWVVLAIDIPALNLQTPKAVEQMFAHIAGAFEQPGIRETFREGYKQRWFSFEIISIEGYIQFLIRTEETYRDLVEAALYAQYPEAEIVEVEDYVTSFPDQYPNDEYDLWAGDFSLIEHEGFPIRTYREFEHTISKDTILKDPMGTFLESFSRIGPGEQMWFQILVQPTSNKWKENSIKKIKEIIGEKSEGKGGIADILTSVPLRTLEGIGDQIFGREASEAAPSGKDAGPKNLLQYLTPGQSKLVEGMEEKISKLGFKTKMRGLYIARKEVFRPERGVNALVGAINQFNIPSANSLEPTYTVSAPGKKKQEMRKRLLMKAYKKRKMNVGANAFILNIEELATVWHFPMSHVKTPLLQKASLKTAEPPSGLPVEQIGLVIPGEELQGSEGGLAKESPTYRTDSGDVGYREPIEFG
jgi:hypothetical protein